MSDAPETVKYTPQPRGRPYAYPWSLWIERLIALPHGQSLKFVKGRDFDCTAESFRTNWYNQNVGVICNIVIKKERDKKEVISVYVTNK